MNHTLSEAVRVSTRRTACTAILAALVSGLLTLAPTARASTNQIAIIQDDLAVQVAPATAMAQFRELGATTIRVLYAWKDVAPDPNSKQAPKHFDGSDPSAYPARNWAVLDAIIRTARADGLNVDLDLAGAPPVWAQGAGVSAYTLKHDYGWRVNARDFGAFVHAVAERYDGKTRVAGRTLPRVSFWSLWNEPNFGQDLGPQAIDATSRSNGISVGPMYYRSLLKYGWSALQQTGHGHDTILVGEFAAEGRSLDKTSHFPNGLPGDYAQTKPLQFVRTLYCLNAGFRELRGTAARQVGCPATASGSKSFRKQNPALFNATGLSVHPYSSLYPPQTKAKIDRDYAIFPVIDNFGSALDKATHVYGATRRFPIYSTEYGYLTSPPQKSGQGYPSPATAAVYLNQAEYLSYKNPRIRSYAQYLLDDPPKIAGHGLFSSGLLTAGGVPKPAFNAYRLPLWVPTASVKRNARIQVWGGARPAHFASVAAHGAQKVEVQLQGSGQTAWKTLATVGAASTNGYFDASVALPSSGSLRLQYTYPAAEPFLPVGVAGTTVVSRTVKVTAH